MRDIAHYYVTYKTCELDVVGKCRIVCGGYLNDLYLRGNIIKAMSLKSEFIELISYATGERLRVMASRDPGLFPVR